MKIFGNTLVPATNDWRGPEGKASAWSMFVRDRKWRRLLCSEDGGPLVEFGMVLLIMMPLLTGIFYIAVSLAVYIQLTNGTDIAARQLSISRGTPGGSDPCNTAVTALENASPSLNTSNLTFSYTIAGTAYSGTSCTAGALTSGSQGLNATVNVSYPVHIGIFGLGWNTVTLRSQTTEIIQ